MDLASSRFSAWLHALAIVSLALAATCALVVGIDLRRHPQKMAIMNAVWPLCALFGSVLWLWLYWRFGRIRGRGIEAPDGKTPMWASVAKGASHCGAGCTLGDIVAEWIALAFPATAVWLGWQTLFTEKTFAVWILDFLLAFVLGIAFQYFTIKPMRELSVRQALVQAVKADTASITSWQVGMYGCMALVQFALIKPAFGAIAPVASPEFWFVMQAAMLCGFVTAYPVNWWLVRSGIKERM